MIATHIDTLKLQVEFLDSNKQRNTISNIINNLPTLHTSYNTNKAGLYTHELYTTGKKILELKSGFYLSMDYKNKKRIPIYYISIEFAGLKRYDEKIDEISLSCLKKVCAYLNSNDIKFFYTGIDICVDMNIPFNLTYGFCGKKAPRVNYYKVNELQPYKTTHYIERYNYTHNQVMKRAYLYDKKLKDRSIDYTLTRFELKLQSKFFNRTSFKFGILKQELDRYYILYFNTKEEKKKILEIYGAIEGTIRRRDLHKLGLDRYRIIPDTEKIEDFLFNLYNIYEHDLDLHTIGNHDISKDFDL